MASLDAAYPTVALVETKHTKGIRGCIYQTTKTLVISKSKNALPDAWAYYTTVRDINISEPLNLSFHTKIVLTLSNSAAVAFSPLGSVS